MSSERSWDSEEQTGSAVGSSGRAISRFVKLPHARAECHVCKPQDCLAMPDATAGRKLWRVNPRMRLRGMSPAGRPNTARTLTPYHPTALHVTTDVKAEQMLPQGEMQSNSLRKLMPSSKTRKQSFANTVYLGERSGRTVK